jgi:hypothetical protein
MLASGLILEAGVSGSRRPASDGYGATTEGERVAAAEARRRIQLRLQAVEQSDPPVEFRFTLADPWSRKLFLALLRRYELKPYRYRGQRRTTIMVKVPKLFVNETLWPEYVQINTVLRAYLDEVSDRILASVIHGGQLRGHRGCTAPSARELANRCRRFMSTAHRGAHATSRSVVAVSMGDAGHRDRGRRDHRPRRVKEQCGAPTPCPRPRDGALLPSSPMPSRSRHDKRATNKDRHAEARARLAALPKLSETMLQFAQPLLDALPSPPSIDHLRQLMMIVTVAWNLPLYEQRKMPEAAAHRATFSVMLMQYPFRSPRPRLRSTATRIP